MLNQQIEIVHIILGCQASSKNSTIGYLASEIYRCFQDDNVANILNIQVNIISSTNRFNRVGRND